VAPQSSKIIQTSTPYTWNFVQAGDGYYYILSSNGKEAITLSGTGDGSDLTMKAFKNAENQKWSMTGAGNGLYYFVPKTAPAKTMDIEGPSTSAGAVIQIWTGDATVPQFKWIVR